MINKSKTAFHVKMGKWLVIKGLLVICRGRVQFKLLYFNARA